MTLFPIILNSIFTDHDDFQKNKDKEGDEEFYRGRFNDYSEEWFKVVGN